MAGEDDTTAKFDDLAERFMEGDETVVPEFVSTYFKKVENIVRLKFGGLLFDDEARGVTQDAFAKAWSKRDQFDICKGTLASWLIKIAINRGNDIIEAGHRDERPAHVSSDEHDIPLLADEDDGEPLDADRLDLIAKVNAFIDTMGPMEQKVARADLAAPGGAADTERLAKIHETTRNNIRQTRSRYRNKIKEHFRGLGYDDDAEVSTS